MDELRAWLKDLLDKVDAHPKYGPAVRQAAVSGRPILLDYHTHAPGQPFCLSIKARKPGLPVLGQAPAMEELAHIKGFGEREEEGAALLQALGEEMRARYGLAADPAKSVAGKPV